MTVFRMSLYCLLALIGVEVFAQTPQDVSERSKELQIELENLRTKYTGKHPEIVRAERELQDLKKYDAVLAAKASPLTSLQSTVKGTFWRNPDWIKMLDLSSDQQKKMDEIFQQYRLKLIDLTASLQKEELILEPLFGTTRPAPENEAKILGQIDRIADARAELEKANSKMLLGILQVLTADQWSKLPMSPKKLPPIYAPLK